MARKYKVRKGRRPFFRFFKRIAKLFLKEPRFINLTGKEPEKNAIYLMNHSGARGPMIFELWFPVRSTPWGAHEMCGNYRERWCYLYYIFYQQKLHWRKPKAFIIATLFAIISKYLYTSVGLIGTYTDAGLTGAIHRSIDVLNEDLSIVIFPEDSREGYFDMPPAFNKGFITLTKTYYRRTGVDLPIYSVYYSKPKNTFVLESPLYVNKMLAEGKSEDEIAELYLARCHKLFLEHIAEKESTETA